MDITEIFKIVCLAGIVLVPYTAIMAAIAIVSTQAKQRSAKRILQAQARGAFADLETPKYKSRFRLLSGIALIGLLGTFFSFGILVLQIVGKLPALYGITISMAIVFGVTSSIAGLLMNREINRRL